MNYFRISLEVGKKHSVSKTIYVRGEQITDAYTISKKIRGGNLKAINTITQDEYLKGVDQKYDAEPNNGANT